MYPTSAAASLIRVEKSTHRLTCSDDSYYLYYVTKGTAVFQTADGPINLTTDDAVLFRPQTPMPTPSSGQCGQLYRLTIPQDIIHYTVLPFLTTLPLFVQFCTHGQKSEHANTYLHFVHTDASLTERILQLESETCHPDDSSQALLAVSLTEVFILLFRSWQVRTTIAERPGSSLLSQVMQYILTQYPTASLQEASRQLNYHPNTISAALRTGLGKSFTEVLLSVRMNHAVDLLLTQELSVEEIASLCGYSNAGSFYRAFHKTYGVTPKEYVLTCRKEKPNTACPSGSSSLVCAHL